MKFPPRAERFKWIAIAGALFLIVLLIGDQIRASVRPELRQRMVADTHFVVTMENAVLERVM